MKQRTKMKEVFGNSYYFEHPDKIIGWVLVNYLEVFVPMDHPDVLECRSKNKRHRNNPGYYFRVCKEPYGTVEHTPGNCVQYVGQIQIRPNPTKKIIDGRTVFVGTGVTRRKMERAITKMVYHIDLESGGGCLADEYLPVTHVPAQPTPMLSVAGADKLLTLEEHYSELDYCGNMYPPTESTLLPREFVPVKRF